MERCESDGKSSLNLFKIATRHCCGKKFFRLYGSFSLPDPCFLPSLSLARAHVLYFRSALPAVSARSWTLGCLRVRSELERKRGKAVILAWRNRYCAGEIATRNNGASRTVTRNDPQCGKSHFHFFVFVKVTSSKDANDVSMRDNKIRSYLRLTYGNRLRNDRFN